MSSNKRNTRWSKTMSWLLRHGIDQTGLNMDEEGYVKVSDMLKLDQFKGCALEIVQEIVATDNKNRYTLKVVNGAEYIRANQGHSQHIAKKLHADKYLQKIETPLDMCVHGTYTRHIGDIQSSGLNRMSRQYIHMANGLPGEVKSGARNSCNVFIHIDMKKAMDDGIVFYLSDNDVILTEGINGVLDPKYFKKVDIRKKQK
jgi:2'-phosphotransferase